jgi:hypothetical protein
MPAMNEQMSIRANGGDGDFTGLKMLGALAAGAALGLLVGLPWGREDSVPALLTIVQTLTTLGMSSSVLLGRLRRPVEPFYRMDVS